MDGTLLGYPDIFTAPKRYGADEVLAPELMRTEPFSSWFTFQDNAVYGCQIAVRAWGARYRTR